MQPRNQSHASSLRALPLWALAVVVFGASACRVQADSVDLKDLTQTLPSNEQETAAPSAQSGLPDLGPIPGSSHWHAAYVVRVCDDVLAPFDTDADPLGIHSHGDGLMHIHPFFEESGYEDAKLALFADAMNLELADGELTLPGGGTWRDGDLCDGVPGRVFVDRWSGPDAESDVERIFEGLDDLRYRADGELYQIAFAPADSFPVVPPALALLGQVSNLNRVFPEPWVDVDPETSIDDVLVWQIADVSETPCTDGQVAERVRSGTPLCFDRRLGDPISGDEAFAGARAVMLNRQPAVEVQMGPRLHDLIADHFSSSENPLAIAIEIDGFVVSTPQLARPPVSSTRLVLTGGFSEETATQLALVLAS